MLLPRSLCILGRLPDIGRAELESLYGAEHIVSAADYAVLSDMPVHDINLQRLGATVKLAQVTGSVKNARWADIQAALSQQALSLAATLAEGKIQIGLSAYGLHGVNPRQLLAAGLEIKKTLRAQGYSVRLTPNQDVTLSSAQVLHNHLTGERGLELLRPMNH